MTFQPTHVQVKQYRSAGDYERDLARMTAQGWVIQNMATTTSRRMLGCLFGLIGYWILPKTTIYHVTYAKMPAAPPTAGPTDAPLPPPGPTGVRPGFTPYVPPGYIPAAASSAPIPIPGFGKEPGHIAGLHWGWWLAIGVVALFAIGAVSNATQDDATDQEASSNEAKAKAATPVPTALPSNVAQIGDLLLRVNAAGPYSDRLFPAEPGTHYIAVDITAKNTGGKTYDLNPLNFRLKDSDKFATGYAITEGPEPRLGAFSMVPGQEVRAYLVFKLGDGRSPVELQYQSFTGTPGVIPINLR